MHHKYKTGSDIAFIRLVILAFVLLLCQSTNVLSQQNIVYVFQNLNQSDGLLHTYVRAIAQDNKGYIWILTTNGLQRYDGSRFVNYPYELNNTNGITDTRNADLFADKRKNCLWITNQELQKFDLEKTKFTSYNAEKILQDSSFKFNNYFDSSGKSWLLGDFGIFRYNGTKKTTSFFITIPSLSPGKSGAFFTDTQKEEIWLVSWGGGLSLSWKKGKKIYTHNYNPLHYPLLQVMGAKNLRGILKDTEGNIWIGSGDQFFYKYNTLSKKLSTYSLLTNKKSAIPDFNLSTVCFFEDNHHTIWIGTENAGLWRYNREKDSFKSILNEDANDHGLKYNYNINCIFQDRDENIWLGTDKGVSIFNPYRQYFQPIHHEENNPLSLPKSEIEHFIQTANKDILIGTWGGGLTVYDSIWNFKKNITFSGHFEYNLIWSLVQHDNGTIWAGCQHGYIHIYDPLTRKIINTVHPPELNNSTIRCMAKDSKGNIWIGLHNGKIAKWDKKQNKFYSYNDSIKGLKQPYAPVLYIFFDNKQRCWVSTENGFKQLDTEKRIYEAVYLPDKKKNVPFRPISVKA